ncbi:MAG TPA: S8 family serine peptidase, partial [Pyrinomonadaceae bacterium]|nr:S8 family serine peptidase [Pyrinomonadaceae bacterium]
MTFLSNSIVVRLRQSIAMTLVVLVMVSPVMAGLNISSADGIVATGADGVMMSGGNGIVATGADSFLTFGPNGIVATGADGIVATGADGIVATGADGIVATGADGLAPTGTNGIVATGADSISITRADGIVATGADGIVATGADGTIYHADSIDIRLPTGIVATGADGIVATGADGIVATGADGIGATGADGIVATGADSLTISNSDGIVATGADDRTFTIPAGTLKLVGADLIVTSNSRDISIKGASKITQTGANALTSALSGRSMSTGLQSLDPELALTLNQMTDDSSVNAVVVYHRLPSDSDLADLQKIGIVGGTRFHVLPAVTLTGTQEQIFAISKLPAVRSIYGNRTLTLTSEPEVRTVTGVTRTWKDPEITSSNRGLPVSGNNVTVAILDTGIDATHADLAGRVTKNIKLADTQSAGVGFNYPINSESLQNTDNLYGHGTFVAGVVSGNGSLSGGKFSGVAPGAKLVGLSAGDLSLLYVLEGFDYLLANGKDLGVRVVNCSFSANTVFDVNDPVNVGTKMLTDAGINVVFSAGNAGPSQHTLNPYAAAPWVVSVGATDTAGKLAGFSSRGSFASPIFRPTLVAPGVDVVSLRGSGVATVTGVTGLAGADTKRLSSNELPYYTTANGTSFSAPQVAGAIALMLEANPGLTTAQVKEILQRTATPLPPYYAYETGAGMLNVHAAVLEAEFPSRRIGLWRGTLDRDQVEFSADAPIAFTGTVQPGSSSETTIPIPAGALAASVRISWGPLWSTNDLGLSVYDQSGVLRGQSNTINLTGLTGKRENVSLATPAAGSLRVSVRNSLGALGTPQKFYGVVEVARVRYARMSDVDSLSPALRDDIYQSLRTFTMWPIGSRFRVDFGISRADLATAMVLGARIPQYLPGQSSYRDVRDASTMLFVESVQASPTGALFTDVSKGGSFRPNDAVTRLTTAVALVRAAGLRSEAEAKAGTPLAFLDVSGIPSELRGYISVAVSHGLLQGDTMFRPSGAFTRAD